MANNGKFLLGALLFIVLSGILFIPKFKYSTPQKQITYTEGIYFKYNDKEEVDAFINSIKRNDGYLCLGTSESGDLNYGNYYNFLNNDTSLQSTFSFLTGAGRTCGLYTPVFLQHKSAVKGLKIIYLINPVYWSKTLGGFQKEYWNRYSSYGMLESIDWVDSINKKYKTDVDIYFHNLDFSSRINKGIEYHIRKYRKRFFSDLYFMLYPKDYEKNFSVIDYEKNMSQFEKSRKIDIENIDTVWNISRKFEHKEWFSPINETENYRYQELKSFVKVCKDLGIKCTFIVGPYNERFIKNHQPDALSGYQKVTENIKKLLIDENADYIDATDISSKPGTFIDHQHHSSYAAYLLYLKIKDYVHEKENN